MECSDRVPCGWSVLALWYHPSSIQSPPCMARGYCLLAKAVGVSTGVIVIGVRRYARAEPNRFPPPPQRQTFISRFGVFMAAPFPAVARLGKLIGLSNSREALRAGAHIYINFLSLTRRSGWLQAHISKRADLDRAKAEAARQALEASASRYLDFIAIRNDRRRAVPTRDISIVWSADLLYGRRWAASSNMPSRRATPRRGLSTSSTVCCRAERSLKVRRDEPGRSRTRAWAPLSAPPSAVSLRSIRWAWASAPRWAPRGAHPSSRVAQRRPRPSGASMRTTLAS